MKNEVQELMLATQNRLLDSTSRQLQEHRKTVSRLLKLLEKTNVSTAEIQWALMPAVQASALVGVVPAEEMAEVRR